MYRRIFRIGIWLMVVLPLSAAAVESSSGMTGKYCARCHNATGKLGGLDLTSLPFEPGNPANFAEWVTTVFAPVRCRPKRSKKGPDPPPEQAAFLEGLASSLTAAEQKATPITSS